MYEKEDCEDEAGEAEMTDAKTPWLKDDLNAYQRAAAFFPEVGLQGDVGDLAAAFEAHGRSAYLRGLEDAAYIAESYEKHGAEWEWPDGEKQARQIAAAIRALAKTPPWNK